MVKNQTAFCSTMAALQPPNPDAVLRQVLYSPFCNTLLTRSGMLFPAP